MAWAILCEEDMRGSLGSTRVPETDQLLLAVPAHQHPSGPVAQVHVHGCLGLGRVLISGFSWERSNLAR